MAATDGGGGNVFPLMVPGATSATPAVEVTAPFDGAPIASVETADDDVVEKALETAYALYRDRGAWLSTEQRIEILEGATRIMADRAEELAIEAAREGGKPLIDSRVEVARAIDSIKLCIEGLRTETGKAIPMNINAASANRLAVTRTEPVGVVVAVSAFNHPLNLIAHQIGPAIATGCPTIVKPAAVTPLSCMRFVEIMRQAGLPDEWCQPVVTSDHGAAEALVTDPRVGFFSFIGSGAVGWRLRSKLSPGTRCALEHGGAAPVILAADADLDVALPSILKGGFYHAGQVCVSVQRVYADASIAYDFAQQLAAEAAKLVVGDPTDAATEVGPLIRPGEVARVAEWVEEASAKGAEILTGGAAIGETCYQPTVLFDPPGDVRVSTNEIFGPVVCVYPFTEMDEAIECANALPFSFHASVYTQDIDTAMRAYAELDASAVMVNDHTAYRVDWMPFAGLRESGLGVGGIPYTMHEMQVQKMIVIRSPAL